jgi:SMODS and SLOG-associating 2TM effector domain family 4
VEGGNVESEQGPRDREHLDAQVREAYGRVAYTHKTHEKMADICFEANRRRRWLQVGLTALSSGAFVASLAGVLLTAHWAALVTSFVAVLVSAVSLTDRKFNFGAQMEQHRDVAARLWDIRERYLSLIVDLASDSMPLDEARRIRNSLQEETAVIHAEAPRTSSKAYARAQEALKFKEDLTFSPEEIDLLLPARLRNGAAG